MQITINVPDRWIAETLERAGSTSWCKRLKFPTYDETVHESCWHALVAGAIPRVRVFERDGVGSENGPVRRYVTLESIAKGVQLLRDLYPHHLGSVLGDEAHCDALTGDALLQVSALGDLVYS